MEERKKREEEEAKIRKAEFETKEKERLKLAWDLAQEEKRNSKK